jgi:hypothetical protein
LPQINGIYLVINIGTTVSNTINISRQELFIIMKNCERKLIADYISFVREDLENRFLLNCNENDFNKNISHFKLEFKSR